MKKAILSLAAIAALSLSAFAETPTYGFGKDGIALFSAYVNSSNVPTFFIKNDSNDDNLNKAVLNYQTALEHNEFPTFQSVVNSYTLGQDIETVTQLTYMCNVLNMPATQKQKACEILSFVASEMAHNAKLRAQQIKDIK